LRRVVPARDKSESFERHARRGWLVGGFGPQPVPGQLVPFDRSWRPRSTGSPRSTTQGEERQSPRTILFMPGCGTAWLARAGSSAPIQRGISRPERRACLSSAAGVPSGDQEGEKEPASWRSVTATTRGADDPPDGRPASVRIPVSLQLVYASIARPSPASHRAMGIRP
jgi:hypothetical protein